MVVLSKRLPKTTMLSPRLRLYLPSLTSLMWVNFSCSRILFMFLILTIAALLFFAAATTPLLRVISVPPVLWSWSSETIGGQVLHHTSRTMFIPVIPVLVPSPQGRNRMAFYNPFRYLLIHLRLLALISSLTFHYRMVLTVS